MTEPNRASEPASTEFAAAPDATQVPAPRTISELAARLSLLASVRSSSHKRVPADVFVTPVEVNDGHGTGVLLRMLFGGDTGGFGSHQNHIVSIRSQSAYGGRCDFGTPLKISQGGATRDAVFSRVAEAVEDFEVRRVMCVPYFPDDVRTAIALQGISGAPLCAFIMDDQNIHGSNIDDESMREMLERASLRLAISPEMRAAYSRKYGLPFYYTPPLVPARMLEPRLRIPAAPPDARHGVMIGNPWSPRAFDLLRSTVSDTGVTLSYPGANARELAISAEELRRAGIHPHDYLDEAELAAMLRATWFGVLASGTLDQHEDRRWLSAMSLPSRLVYMVAVAHLPVIVLGSRETAAAHFVKQFGVGVCAGYNRGEFLKAVEQLTTPEINIQMRRRACAISGRFSDAGVGEWIWQSLERGEPLDGRFEDLLPRIAADGSR